MDTTVWVDGQPLVVTDMGDEPVRPRRARASVATLRVCVNCDRTWKADSRRVKAYCSPSCRTQAAAVRAGRAIVRQYGSPRLAPQEARYGFGIKMAHALGDGYDSTARAVSPTIRQAVWERDHGLCVTCRQPGQEIDHVSGPSSDLENLRLLCTPCHRQVTATHLRSITDPAMRALRAALIARIQAAEPARDCDRENWDNLRAAWCAGPGLAAASD